MRGPSPLKLPLSLRPVVYINSPYANLDLNLDLDLDLSFHTFLSELARISPINIETI